MEEQREENILHVEDAMQLVSVPVLTPEETVDRALQEAVSSGADSVLVRLRPEGWSSVTRDELQAMVDTDMGGATVSSVLNDRRIPYLHPDHPLETALRYVERWPIVPVVSRADFRKLEGVISQRDVLERYREFGEA
jgi:CBS domain-containing protein